MRDMLHDYLRDTLELGYNECKSCRNRTQFTYMQCGFCYSCHWKKERLEKVQLEPLLKTNSALLENYSQSPMVKIKQSHQLKQKLLTYTVKKQNRFATIIHAVTNFHCMVLVLVSVSATIHRIIL
jgi:hypothetical protein